MNYKEKQKIIKIKEHAKTIEAIKVIIDATLYWDSIVNVPDKGVVYRLEMIEHFAIHLHQLASSKTIMKYMDEFYENNFVGLDDITVSVISNLREYCKSISVIPPNEYKNYVSLSRGADRLWEKARTKNDFTVIENHLEHVVDSYKKLSKNWNFGESAYDAILNFNEVGMTTKQLDSIFSKLKPVLLRIVREKKRNNPKTFVNSCDKKTQKIIVERILNDIGFDFSSGRVDEAMYAMTLACGYSDVRIMINYDENNIMQALTTALHCGSQAVYEQNISEELYGLFLASPSSMGIYEGVSRMFETMIGYNKSFCEYITNVLSEYDVEIDAEQFYDNLCIVDPSSARSEADEVSYNLHIIMRYEIEKMLFEDTITVADLPRIWKEKYFEYFGIEISNDNDGVLQDIHWYSGYFGYFPLYAIGNVYAAQIYETMSEDISNIDDKIRTGDYEEIINWLSNSIFKHGSKYTTPDLVYMICEDELNIDYYIKYLNAKYDV